MSTAAGRPNAPISRKTRAAFYGLIVIVALTAVAVLNLARLALA